MPAISLSSALRIAACSVLFHDESAAHRPSVFQFLNLNSDLDSPDYNLVVEKGVLAIKHQLAIEQLGFAISIGFRGRQLFGAVGQILRQR
jgi:hypothetical protein